MIKVPFWLWSHIRKEALTSRSKRRKRKQRLRYNKPSTDFRYHTRRKIDNYLGIPPRAPSPMRKTSFLKPGSPPTKPSFKPTKVYHSLTRTSRLTKCAIKSAKIRRSFFGFSTTGLRKLRKTSSSSNRFSLPSECR